MATSKFREATSPFERGQHKKPHHSSDFKYQM